MEDILANYSKIFHLVELLSERIFTPTDTTVDLLYRQAPPAARARMLEGPHDDWSPVTPDTVWGEPQSYFWFAGSVLVPDALEGKRVCLGIEAMFGRVMGRSDPQCLVRVNGEIVQGADYNHREILLTARARGGERFDIMIEAGTIEDRRQLGFAGRLLVHDLEAEALYYDLRAPLDVAKHLDINDHRRDFILKTVYQAINAVDFRPGNLARFAESLKAASAIAERIYKAGDTEIAPHITVTGHTHIDVAWLWRIRETRQKMARSMATALSLMRDYPEYRFMYNQGLLLDYLEQDYPALFAGIREQHREGRFEIEGALWLEPDANITSGESLVRHVLRGVRYHVEKFGVRPRILWLPDTFGYSAAIPQIMKLAGLTVFVTHKLSWNDTNRMPGEVFFWQGIDGTRAPTYFLTTQPADSTSIGTTYCPDLKASHVMGAWRRYAQKETNDELFLVYGFGDGGGGPTREMLEHIRRMERGIPGCPRVSQGFMGPVLERIVGRMHESPKEYPVWVGELYLEFHRGTFTSVAKVKRNNRRAEAMLRELEALASLAWFSAGIDYPEAELAALWDIALLNQFHDILPGSSIGLVFDDSDEDYATFFARAEALRRRLASCVAGEGETLLVNAFGRPRGGLVRLASEAPLRLGDRSSQVLVSADGTLSQAVPVDAIPGLGAVRLTLAASPEPAAGDGGLAVTPNRLENAFLRAEFDAGGRLVSLVDKKSGRECLTGVANRLQAYRDFPEQFDAWDIDRTFEDQVFEIDGLVKADVVETGPYRAALRFEWRYEASRIVEVVSLEAESRALEFDSFIDWREHNTMVKAAFPLAVRTADCDAEIQFGHVTRPTHANTSWDQARFESPMHRWVSLCEDGFGVALLNDCKYGYDARDTTIRLTLLRSPTYPWPEADQGEHRFRYAIMPHDGLGSVSLAAEAFNHPLMPVAGSGDGSTAKLTPPFSVDNDAIAVESVKRAEDGRGLVVRLWERRGARQNARLTLDTAVKKAREVDLLEEPVVDLCPEAGILALGFAPFEIKTLKLERE
ncbi:glycoside hydrolase family 38 C-terminal domain-containing protein [Martelella sp. AD-3]|uniref:alpha-mannosidase n=1 Tax=Martelella sp. AD-3 TaxID=686597 RepID=UPI000463AC7D|nr:glycoside hydrolase family 38 C-terminal domain-containing protein [Martelella sp. AD-3]AMM84551.1 alpha-mannosidase [Martelella sp. AD-3]